ncbi:hypothetical protein HPTD01_3493 [Halomonas sp. TD01]|nr:hypothetical protein HPTD01_3493 [Halomonas sp. TD01]
MHLHLSSSATWEQASSSSIRLDDGPDSLKSLHEALQRTS